MTGYFGATLPEGVRSRSLEAVNGLIVHLLEAGEAGGSLVVLLHGFPELAWSWRRVIPRLAAAGYHVVAPDLRGYGDTTGWDPRFDCDLGSFRPLNHVQDVLELLFALDLSEVRAVVGHDFGSAVAAHCALVRPDVFRSLVLMSGPFPGTPAQARATGARGDLDAALAGCSPPRKHYQRYFSGREAEPDMLGAPQG